MLDLFNPPSRAMIFDILSRAQVSRVHKPGDDADKFPEVVSEIDEEDDCVSDNAQDAAARRRIKIIKYCRDLDRATAIKCADLADLHNVSQQTALKDATYLIKNKRIHGEWRNGRVMYIWGVKA